MSRLLIKITLIASCWFTCASAEGQIILDFTRTNTGGVRVTGSGSGRTTNFAWSNEFRTLDFDNDFLSDTLGTGFINADSVTGQVQNSWGFTRRINNFSVGRSTGSNDDIRFNTQGAMFFWFNQPYTFTIEAIFDRSTLAFDDLISGTYFDAARNDNTEIFGRTRINVESVPEPRATMIIAGAGLLGLIVVRTVDPINVLERLAKQTVSDVLAIFRRLRLVLPRHFATSLHRAPGRFLPR